MRRQNFVLIVTTLSNLGRLRLVDEEADRQRNLTEGMRRDLATIIRSLSWENEVFFIFFLSNRTIMHTATLVAFVTLYYMTYMFYEYC